jgi:hypothetical protein
MHSKQNYKCKSELTNAKESRKSPTDGEDERAQALDQSYKEPKKISIILAEGISLFSKVRLFLSLHKVHIRQEGINKVLSFIWKWLLIRQDALYCQISYLFIAERGSSLP